MGVLSHHKKSTGLIIFLVCQLMSAGIAAAASVASEAAGGESKSTSTTDVTNSNKDNSDTVQKSDLEHAETKDPQKLEIIKQIRKINNDGSYTVGYEAEDGTFKIESRDVLGNVKGTYGYIDENGDIKRVSYAANNSTGLKMQPVSAASTSTSTSTATSVEDVVHIPRQNRTQFTLAASTTRRPAALAYLTSTASPTRTSVIQSIPKRRILFPTSTERTTYTNLRTTEVGQTSNSEPTTTVVYATSVPTPKPYTLARPTSLPQYSSKNNEQIARPEKLEIDQISKVYISNNNKEATKLIIKEGEKKTLRGNNLRRQLHHENEDEAFEAQQQVIYSQSAGEDASHVYGGGGGGIRPLFTTTSSPRVPAAVIAARQRAAHLQSVLSGTMPSTTTERVYVKPPRRQETKTSDNETTEPNPDTDNSFLTQNPAPIVQIPANRDVTETAGDERRTYRQRPTIQIEPVYRPRDGARYIPQAAQQGGSPRTAFRIPLAIPQQVRPAEQEQYIRETTPALNRGQPFQYNQEPSEDDAANANDIPPIAFRGQRRFPPPAPSPSPQAYADNPYAPEQQQLQPQVAPQNQLNGYQSQSSYLSPFGYNPYRQQFSSPYYDNPDRPLTARDFDRLLQLLLLRHQINQQRFGGVGGAGGYGGQFYPGGVGGPLSPGFNPSPYGYQQIPRPPFYGGYDRNYQNPNYSPSTSLRQYSDQGSAYQSTNALSSGEQPGNPYEGQQRLIPRRRQFRGFNAVTPIYPTAEQEFGASNNIEPSPNYLPSEVREDLLYRMLMLAIQSEQQLLLQSPSEPVSDIKATAASELAATTTAANKFRKPVRSVQILGEE